MPYRLPATLAFAIALASLAPSLACAGDAAEVTPTPIAAVSAPELPAGLFIIAGPPDRVQRVMAEGVLGPFQHRTGLAVDYRTDQDVDHAALWLATEEQVIAACDAGRVQPIVWPIIDRMQTGGISLVPRARHKCGAGLLIDRMALVIRTAPVVADEPDETATSAPTPETGVDDADIAAPSPSPVPVATPWPAATGWADFFNPERPEARIVVNDLRGVAEAAYLAADKGGQDKNSPVPSAQAAAALADINAVSSRQTWQDAGEAVKHLNAAGHVHVAPSAGEALAMLVDGRATMGILPASIVQGAIEDDLAPLKIVDGAELPYMLMLAIPKGSPLDEANAHRLIGFALQPEIQAGFARSGRFGLSNTRAQAEMEPWLKLRQPDRDGRLDKLPLRDAIYWASTAGQGWWLDSATPDSASHAGQQPIPDLSAKPLPLAALFRPHLHIPVAHVPEEMEMASPDDNGAAAASPEPTQD